MPYWGFRFVPESVRLPLPVSVDVLLPEPKPAPTPPVLAAPELTVFTVPTESEFPVVELPSFSAQLTANSAMPISKNTRFIKFAFCTCHLLQLFCQRHFWRWIVRLWAFVLAVAACRSVNHCPRKSPATFRAGLFRFCKKENSFQQAAF